MLGPGAHGVGLRSGLHGSIAKGETTYDQEKYQKC